MKDANKVKLPFDVFLLDGLLMYCAYLLTKRFVTQIPDSVAYTWMIISCVFMLIGVFRTGKQLGGFFSKK